MKKNPDQFLFPEEEVLQEKIRSLGDDLIASSTLVQLGFFKHSRPISWQVATLDLPVQNRVSIGIGHTYIFKKSDLINSLGSSRLLPFSILALACGIGNGRKRVEFAKSIRSKGIEIKRIFYIARADAIRIYQEHLKTKSGGSAVKPDRDPPGQQNSLNPAPPGSVATDHLRRVVEALLLLTKHNQDLMGRCQVLLEKVSDDFETQKKANRVLFKMADEHKMALKKIMASFEISTE